VKALIALSSAKYGLDARIVASVVECESGGNPVAIGDHGTSFGIAQIHLIAHPNITKTQAFDPVFAIDYMAREISLGNGSMWTCYGMIRES
jgi:soluble lytic murein transglycosylase-like protein